MHYCPYRCCESPEETQEIFCTLVVSALLPSKCGILSRKSWTNSEKSFNWTGLFSCTWNLLGKIINKSTGKAVANPEFESTCTAEEMPSEPISSGAVHDVGEGGSSLIAFQENPETAASDVDWATINRTNAKSALGFARTEFLRDILTIIRLVMEPGLYLIHTQLKLSGDEWEKLQQSQTFSGTERTFQVLESPKVVKKCFLKILKSMFGMPVCLPVRAYTRQFRALSFRMLSALACSLEFLVRRYQKIFPHRLFELLRPLEFNKQSVFDLPACLRDPLAQHFFELYTHESAFEAKAQAYLSAVAQMIELDIADVESKHSSIRELTMLRSRGHQISLQELSARDLFHFVGKKYDVKFQEYESGHQHQNQQPEPDRITDDAGFRQGTKRKYSATVGGAWRAFLRTRAAGEPLAPQRIKTLPAEYRALSHDEYQHFKDMGFAAVARHELALASASFRRGAPTDNSSAVVAASSQEVGTMLSSPSWGMCDYDSFCRAVCDVAAAKRQLAKAQAQKASENQASLESQTDRTWQTELHKHGSALVKHICQKPVPPTSRAKLFSYHWIPPVIDLVQAGLFLCGKDKESKGKNEALELHANETWKIRQAK